MITGVWISPDGERLAVQLDEESIFLTDYACTITPVEINAEEIGHDWPTLRDIVDTEGE